MESNEKKSVFQTLYNINVNSKTEKKKMGGSKELTYLSWSWAFAEVKKLYPDASYTIYKDEQNRPFVEDPDLGLMCFTTVTIEGQTHEMWLPVMNSSNKAMKRKPYSYKVLNNQTRQYEDRWVEAATMMDINKTIMRCLVKNLAMFGLGLYIYADEDLPESEVGDAPQEAKPLTEEEKQFQDTLKNYILPSLKQARTEDDVTRIWQDYADYQKVPAFINALNERVNEIRNGL